MEISNLIAKFLSDMDANRNDSVPWSDSPWAEQSMSTLRNLYANSAFEANVHCPFDLMILPLRQISLPATHFPSHPDFQRGWQEASIIEKFLNAHQKPPQSPIQNSQPAASIETAGLDGGRASARTTASMPARVFNSGRQSVR